MLRVVGEGFAEIDERIDYFVKFAHRQNFGDYLPELICKELLGYPRIDADVFRLIGSVIDDRWARQDLQRINGRVAGLIAYWGCGARSEAGLDEEVSRCCRFFGVRGPLTRDALKLPPETVLGDPGFLAPLFHVPRPGVRTAGRTICIPHIQDPSPPADRLEASGCELLVQPEVDASEAALRTILDEIAAADFILTGSLHGAIIACAYGRPFAFWDPGYLDVPFKWRDLAASLEIPLVFAKSLSEGREIYSDVIAPVLKIPPRAPLLDVCPFTVRPAAYLRALALDGRLSDGLPSAVALLDGMSSQSFDEVVRLQRASQANRTRRSGMLHGIQAKAWRNARALKRRVRERLQVPQA